jgi:hypothetical protein
VANSPTINLTSPRGIWRPIYTRRLALHATADAIVLAAWRADADGVDLAPAITAWRMAVGEAVDPMVQHRRDAAAAAILALLANRTWARTRAALTLATTRAHHAGWAAGLALTAQDHGDDTPYDDSGSEYSISSPHLTDDATASTTASTLGAALRTTAKGAGRAAADSDGNSEMDAQNVVASGSQLTTAVDVAVSATYGAGLLAAYIGAGSQAVRLITAGDRWVCDACHKAELSSPYPLLGAPQLPLHPRCRCILAPT